MQTDKCKQQCQRNDDRYNERSAPVKHEQGHQYGEQDNSLSKVMGNSMCSIFRKVRTVIVWNDVRVPGQDTIIQLFYFFLNGFYYFRRVSAFSHYYYSLYHIRL